MGLLGGLTLEQMRRLSDDELAELEALLQDIEGEYANYTGSREMLPRIRAALAKVE